MSRPGLSASADELRSSSIDASTTLDAAAAPFRLAGVGKTRGSYVSKDEPRRDLGRSRNLTLSSLAVERIERLARPQFQQVEGAVVRQVEDLQRRLEAIAADSDVLSETD